MHPFTPRFMEDFGISGHNVSWKISEEVVATFHGRFRQKLGEDISTSMLAYLLGKGPKDKTLGQVMMSQ